MFELNTQLVNEIIATNAEFDYTASKLEIAQDYYYQTTLEQRVQLCEIIGFNHKDSLNKSLHKVFNEIVKHLGE
ncbi:MAG: hypothetical protein ACRC3J_05135 [Culicoidibacterales bacterium]